MRFFGFFIIRWQRLQEIHARQKDLMLQRQLAVDHLTDLSDAVYEYLNHGITNVQLLDSVKTACGGLSILQARRNLTATAPADDRGDNHGDTNG